MTSRKIKILSIATLIVTLASPSSYAEDAKLVDSQKAISNVSVNDSYHPMKENLPSQISVGNSNNILDVDSNDLKIEVPKDAKSPVLIADSEGENLIKTPVENDSAKAQIVEASVVGFKGESYDSYTSLKETGDVQFSNVIKNNTAPSEYAYTFTLEDGEHFSKIDKYIVVLDSHGDISAVVDEPWAKDALGKDVPTYFEIQGEKLIQHVEHKSGKYTYPIVADPVYSRGIISKVVAEEWTAKTHWHVAINVTLKARALWGIGQSDKVYRDGLADLRQHHPTSMGSDTMAQQWECHVVGLPMTRTIDLESIRPSNPHWRERIPTLQKIVREGRGSIYSTCNW